MAVKINREVAAMRILEGNVCDQNSLASCGTSEPPRVEFRVHGPARSF